MQKLFFTSYAHVNRDKLLDKFVEKLRDEVLQRGPGGIQLSDIVFFDSEGIQTGEEWALKLTAAVSNSKVCVAVCSPAYFASKFCGKEIRIFLERLNDWHAKPENAGVPGRAIIPVIWVKSKLPDVLGKFQYDDNAFPKDYREQGLRTLYQLSKYKDHRTKVLIALAERIVVAANSDLPPKAQIPHFDFIPSVFHDESVGTRYGIAVIALLKGELSSKPYGQETTLNQLMDDACGARIPWRAMVLDNTLQQQFQEARSNREGILVIADLDTLADPLYRDLVETVDKTMGEQSALLIFAPTAKEVLDGDQRNVEITLTGHFPNALAKVWHRDLNSIRSIETLRKALEVIITSLRTQLVKEDPAREVRDPQISAAAAAAGVPIERQPVIGGPGGN